MRLSWERSILWRSRESVSLTDLRELSGQIVEKIRVANAAHVHRISGGVQPAKLSSAVVSANWSPASRISTEKLIAIGASTGGTEAIKGSSCKDAGQRTGDCYHPTYATGVYD